MGVVQRRRFPFSSKFGWIYKTENHWNVPIGPVSALPFLKCVDPSLCWFWNNTFTILITHTFLLYLNFQDGRSGVFFSFALIKIKRLCFIVGNETISANKERTTYYKLDQSIIFLYHFLYFFSSSSASNNIA